MTSHSPARERQTFFRFREPRRPKPIPASWLFHLPEYQPVDNKEQHTAFSLEDFITAVSDVHDLSLDKTKQIVYSRHTYKKLHKLLAEFLQPNHTTVTKINITAPGWFRYSSVQLAVICLS